MAGPTERDHPLVVRGEDGRFVHTYRQSQLGEMSNCMERTRRSLLGLSPDRDTDAAAMGTAMHAAIEGSLLEYVEYGTAMSPSAMTEMAMREFAAMAEDPTMVWKKYNAWGVERFLSLFPTAWHSEVLPQLAPRAMEIGFGPIVVYEDDHRVIQITGSIDYDDEVMGYCDWKSAGDGRKYGADGWKLKRWAVQPTVYTLAGVKMGRLDPDPEAVHPFTYFAFVVGKEVVVKKLTVYRHAGDHAWLIDMCKTYSVMIEAELDVWPKNDTHALCSPAWCDSWDACKGQFYSVGWPEKSAPVGTSVQ